jgi:RNA polymerase sigma-70 factor (ECF subfamily)
MEQESHDILLGRIAAGDQNALRDLYTGYRPRLWRYLRSRLDGDMVAVDDLLQEIFLAIWNAAPRYRPQLRAAAWIFQIAQYQLGHAQRAISRRPEGHLVQDDEPGSYTSIHDQQSALEDDVIGRVALAESFAQLSPAHREVLLLVFQQGFALGEAASILGVPLGTVKSRISYARRALHRLHLGLATQGEKLA